MSSPKWLVVAKNQYRIMTSSIRSIRRYFPFIAVGLLAVYVAFVAPVITNLFMDQFLAFIITQAAIPFMQIILFMFFFYLMIFPISDTLREEQTPKLEIFLAAPINPSDILLGEFLGKLPVYAIAIIALTGTFTALLNPLGLDFAQKGIIIAVFFLILLSASWIGTVIAAVLRTSLGKSTRGKDVGRALSLVIALPMIAVMYAIYGGGLIRALVDPSTSGIVRTILGFLPSSWGADIFVSFANNPGNIGAVGFETLIRILSLIAFSGVVLWLGSKAAGRAYSLESFTFTASRAKADGLFYSAVRSVGGGGSSGTLLKTVFKDYCRRLENLSWIVYMVGLIILITVFLSNPFTSPGDTLFFLSLMAIPLMAGFTVGTLSRGKETFFQYKKAPNGIARFLKAKLLQSIFVAVPIIAVIISVFTLFAPNITVMPLLANIVLGSLRTMSSILFLFGLSLLIPVFSEGTRERTFGIMIYLQAAIFTTIGFEIGLPKIGLNFRSMIPGIDPFIGSLGDHMLQTSIFALMGIVFTYLGTKKLNRIE